ncbi:MAG TPA: U32 family peptidase [Acidobacteriota bacterium]|nr:U32 family peptidase [Acidobacteriota bacterium]
MTPPTAVNRAKILAPAGSFESLAAAINAGADAIYFGCGGLNMRAKSGNFSIDDLPVIVSTCKKAHILCYMTLNALMYDEDLEQLRQLCKIAREVGVDAVICSDIAAIQIAREFGLRIHISTQQNISNIEAVRFFSQFADTIVLARELTLAQIKSIHTRIIEDHICGPSGQLLEIEAFVHGALCVAVSGKCGMSLATYNSSANRGACVQVCRRSYTVTDTETGSQLDIDGKYVMSPRDLCTLPMLSDLIKSGVTLLKIEGRARGPDYVSTVVRAYKEAVSRISHSTYTDAVKTQLLSQVRTVYNRDFWMNGYYLGKSTGEWCTVAGSCATQFRTIIGKVENYYTQSSVALITLETRNLSQGCTLAFSGPTTGYLLVENVQLQIDGSVPSTVLQGSSVTVVVPSRVRKNDKVFLIEKR